LGCQKAQWHIGPYIPSERLAVCGCNIDLFCSNIFSGGGGANIKDFNVVREMVQKLCQTSHPLAKSMDYLQVRVKRVAELPDL
jgi:hypothetical protein